MKKRGIRKQVKGGKIKEVFEIKTDARGNNVVTGHKVFGNDKKKEREVKGGK